MKKIAITGIFLFTLPFLAGAQSTNTVNSPNLSWLGNLIAQIGHLLNAVIPVLIALTLLYLFYNIFRYVQSPEKKEKGGDPKAGIIAGVIGLFIMLSIWGIIGLLQGTFGVSSNNSTNGNVLPPSIPQLK